MQPPWAGTARQAATTVPRSALTRAQMRPIPSRSAATARAAPAMPLTSIRQPPMASPSVTRRRSDRTVPMRWRSVSARMLTGPTRSPSAGRPTPRGKTLSPSAARRRRCSTAWRSGRMLKPASTARHSARTPSPTAEITPLAARARMPTASTAPTLQRDTRPTPTAASAQTRQAATAPMPKATSVTTPQAATAPTPAARAVPTSRSVIWPMPAATAQTTPRSARILLQPAPTARPLARARRRSALIQSPLAAIT